MYTMFVMSVMPVMFKLLPWHQTYRHHVLIIVSLVEADQHPAITGHEDSKIFLKPLFLARA